MPYQPLAADTDAEIEQMQIAGWRAMTPAQKAEIVSGLTIAAFTLARAGMAQRFPDASPREQTLRLALLTLGDELATRAYPEAATLVR
jgi:hypothetical protein